MLAAIVSLAALGAGPPPGPELTTTRAVRQLSRDDARAGMPVRITGRVTFAPGKPYYFYVQDGTGGVRVEWRDCAKKLRPGEVVEVAGATAAGEFYPHVEAAKDGVTPAGAAVEAHPQPFNLTRDEAYYLDSQWVEVEAVVQRAWAPPREDWLKVDLARGRGQAVAYIPLPLGAEVERAERLRGAVVRVRGVWQHTGDPSNPSRLLVAGVGAFKVVRSPGESEKLPELTAAQLNQFRPDPINSRLPVRVSGVVTMNQIRGQVYVQNPAGVVYLSFAEPIQVATGQRIEAAGFPRATGTTDPPLLENAEVISLNPPKPAGDRPLPLPDPVPGSVAEASAGKHDGRVLRFTGVVHSSARYEKWQTYTLLVDHLTFTVVMLGEAPELEAGSTVEVVGVATRQQFPNFPRHTFALFTRVGDLKVLSGPPEVPPPSWWSGRRVAYLTAGRLGLLLLSGATATAMRVQARRAAELARRREEENERLEAQLKQAANLGEVGKVASGVAHDFNNLLTVINGCSQLMSEVMTDDPAHARTLAAEITRNVQHAASLIRLLMSVSGQRQVVPRPVDLNAVVTDTAALLGRVMGQRLAVRVEAEPGLPPVTADTALLLQVVLNLAVNARDAMPAGGTFTLATASPRPGLVRLTAADTGTGMTEEVKRHLFERGFTTKGEGRGTGLGLSTVLDVVTRLGGDIRFRSELGRGTEFEIDLPAADSPRALPPAP